MWDEFSNSQCSNDCTGLGRENGHRDRAGDTRLAGIGLGDTAEVLLEVAKFHRFLALRSRACDALAEWDMGNSF